MADKSYSTSSVTPEAAALQKQLEEYRTELVSACVAEKSPEESGDYLYCTCRLAFNGIRTMIQCDSCGSAANATEATGWYHITCLGIPSAELESIGTYMCPLCDVKNRKELVLAFGSLDTLISNGIEVGASQALIARSEAWLINELFRIHYEVEEMEDILKLCDKKFKKKKKTAKKKSVGRKKQEKQESKYSPEDEQVLQEVGELCKSHNLTYSRVASEAKLPGGSSALSAMVNHRIVAKMQEKIEKLKEWLAQFKADLEKAAEVPPSIEENENQNTTRKRAIPIEEEDTLSRRSTRASKRSRSTPTSAVQPW